MTDTKYWPIVVASFFIMTLHLFPRELRAETFLLMEYVQVVDEEAWLALNQQLEPQLSAMTSKTDLVSRVVLKLWYPHPGGRDFNYLLLTEYKTFDALQHSSAEFIRRHVHADNPELRDLLRELERLAIVTSQEITSSYWREHLVARSIAGQNVMGHLSPGDWAMFQYLSVDPDMWGPYSEMEEKVWKPIHLANIEKGRLKFWTLLGYYFESRKIDYDLFAVLVYPSFERLELNIYTHDTWIEVHGEGHDVFDQTFANRTQVQAHLWKVVFALR